MSDILDDFSEKRKSNKYIESAYKKLIYTSFIFIFVLLIILIGLMIEYLGFFAKILIVGLLFSSFIFCVIGFFQSITSFWHKEENTFQKWLALFGNLFFILLHSGIIFLIILGVLAFG